MCESLFAASSSKLSQMRFRVFRVFCQAFLVWKIGGVQWEMSLAQEFLGRKSPSYNGWLAIRVQTRVAAYVQQPLCCFFAKWPVKGNITPLEPYVHGLSKGLVTTVYIYIEFVKKVVGVTVLLQVIWHAQVSLEDWIERRIGGEVEIQQAVKPGCVFHLEDGFLKIDGSVVIVRITPIYKAWI